MDTEPASPQPPAEQRRCDYCGAPLDASVRYCPACGRTAGAPAPDVDIGGWVKAGWDLFVNNVGLAIGIPLVVGAPVFVLVLGGYVAIAVPMVLSTAGQHRGPSLAAVIAFGSVVALIVLILNLVMPALQAGVYACFLEGIRTRRLTAHGLARGFHQWWACTWVMWVLTAAMVICVPFIFILVGIPALIGVQTLMWLALFRIVDKGRGGVEALSFAWGAMGGRFWWMLLLTFVMSAVMNAGAMVLWFGMLVSMPVGLGGLAAAYDALSKKEEPPGAAS